MGRGGGGEPAGLARAAAAGSLPPCSGRLSPPGTKIFPGPSLLRRPAGRPTWLSFPPPLPLGSWGTHRGPPDMGSRKKKKREREKREALPSCRFCKIAVTTLDL